MKTKCTVLAIFLVGAICGFAQESPGISPDPYGLGDQIFSINAGMIVPLFIHSLDGTIEPALSHLSLGAAGSLQWGAFLNGNTTLGAELGGMFSFTILKRTLILLPITGLLSYTIRFYPFELAMNMSVGGTFIKLDSDLYFGPILKPGIALYWNYNAEWAFGIKAEYWWSAEIYFGTDPPSSESSFGNFLGITFSTLYHF